MAKASSNKRRRPSSPQAEDRCGICEARFGGLAGIVPAARALWPVKTAAHLALHAEISQRRAEQVLAGRGDLSLRAFVALLNGDDGHRFLAAAMAGSEVGWWRLFGASMQVRSMSRRLRELQHAFASAKSAHAELAELF